MAAKIIDEYIGENGTVSNELKNSYIKGDETEQVKDLKECMIKDINTLADKYKNKLHEDQLSIILEECRAVI